ncbi:unnamed protein product [Parascedosporium putredinis]|uniref:Squalene monooxygenase n=1 Tax=Parascedosporium putredinis TaxID=1442378 RepID=A0A9P1GV13_9PEZI|nr:unnamed protein product [Parascedosporium putredinis]CAI7987638.1 unnamed protein product [Parascedosporium putredinis]
MSHLPCCQTAVEVMSESRRRNNYHEAEVVVVGAGVFGCAVAFALANQGRSVLLLERWMHQPDRIVGELLQPGGVAALRKLGLEHCLEGIDAVPCIGYNVIYDGTPCAFPYPMLDDKGNVVYEKSGSGDGKRPEGKSFHHGRFIMKLRKRALPTRTSPSSRPRRRSPSGATRLFFGQLTIIADGYASTFRAEHLQREAVVKSKFYALELIDCPLLSPYHGHVVIGNTFPTLLYQIGTHETRALIDVPEGLPAAAPAAGGVKGYIKNVVTAKGLIVLGDAMNMRHPLTGGGMTVAFNDVVLLADLLAPEKVPTLGNLDAVQNAMDTFHWRRKRLTSIINVLAMALYNLFAADSWQLRALQRGCFEYFQRGVTEDPSGLLGGVIHSPAVLAYHFFTVAFVGIWLNIKSTLSSAGILAPLCYPLPSSSPSSSLPPPV